MVQFSIVSFSVLAVAVMGLLLSAILWRFADHKNNNNKILSVAMLAITWATFILFSVETGLMLAIPSLYRTGQLAILIYIPMMYLYTRTHVTRKPLSPPDLLHALPLLFFLIDYLPFFMLSSGEKLALVREDFPDRSNYYRMNDFDEGWITPAGFHYYFRYILMAVYFVIQLKLLYHFLFKRHKLRTTASGSTKAWLITFVSIQLLPLVPLIIQSTDGPTQWLVASLSVIIPELAIAGWLFFRPDILYGYKSAKVPVLVEPQAHLSVNIQKNNSQPQNNIASILEQHMTQSKKYLKHKYSIHELSNDIHIPPHQISNFLNHNMNVSYNDFLNKYRIEYTIQKIRNGEAEKYTLEALSSECGFSNRNSFTSAFKRFTGVTPSEFMKSLK